MPVVNRSDSTKKRRYWANLWESWWIVLRTSATSGWGRNSLKTALIPKVAYLGGKKEVFKVSAGFSRWLLFWHTHTTTGRKQSLWWQPAKLLLTEPKSSRKIDNSERLDLHQLIAEFFVDNNGIFIAACYMQLAVLSWFRLLNMLLERLIMFGHFGWQRCIATISNSCPLQRLVSITKYINPFP